MVYGALNLTLVTSLNGKSRVKSGDIRSAHPIQSTITIKPNKYFGLCSYPDKYRGLFNEGGLFGERKGWHLPGFDTSSWSSRDLSSGLPGSSAGVGFFVTTFDLKIPSYQDAFISFTFDDSAQPYRAYLFVNGWMMGKRVANLGSVTDLRTCTCIYPDTLFIQSAIQIPCPSGHLRLRWHEVGHALPCNRNQADEFILTVLWQSLCGPWSPT